MKIKFFIVSCCLIGTVLCNKGIELAPVSARERKQGYSCKSSSKALGLMRSGEAKTNFIPGQCIGADCENGVISYYGCGTGVLALEGEICRTQPDDSLPYPDCCHIFKC